MSNGHHHYSFASVRPHAARVVTDYSSAFHPAPFASVKVHVGSADAACFEFHENFFA
jgi:hypothetical protein